MSSERYDQIAQEYKVSKRQHPHRIYAEEYSLFKLLGTLAGKKVLDLACGDGIYSRKMKLLGAESVIGLDISERMIELAKKEEADAPLGVTYHCQAVQDITTIGEFDIILAAYLLNYAKTKEELSRLCKAAHSNLKRGGRVVGINDNPFNSPAHYKNYRKYGFEKETIDPRTEGDVVTYRNFEPGGSVFTFDNYYWSPETYSTAFEKAGFSSFRWVNVQISEEGIARMGNDFWTEFILDPPIIGLEAVK